MNYNAYTNCYVWDIRNETHAMVSCMVWNALFELIQGVVRACMAVTIGMQPFTALYFPRKVIKSCHIEFGTALSCAALSIQMDAQPASRSLTYIATNMRVKCIFD